MGFAAETVLLESDNAQRARTQRLWIACRAVVLVLTALVLSFIGCQFTSNPLLTPLKGSDPQDTRIPVSGDARVSHQRPATSPKIGAFDRGDLRRCFNPSLATVRRSRHGDVRRSISYAPVVLESEDIYLFAPAGRQPQNLVGSVSFEVDPSVEHPTATLIVDGDLPPPLEFCLFQRQSGARGLGILVYDLPPELTEYSTSVHLTVTFPSSGQMSARSLESSLVNFTHTFRDGLSFGSVALEGHSGDINFESTEVQSLSVSSKAAVTGSLNSTCSTVINTTGTPIDLHLSVKYGGPNACDGHVPMVSLSVTNSTLKATLDLYTHDSDDPGTFDISTTTTNGPLSVHFSSAPPSSTLNLRTSSSLFPAHISLASTYEGSFFAHSLGSRSDMHFDGYNTPDPTEQGRQRRVRWEWLEEPERWDHGFFGKTWWAVGWNESDGRPEGDVRVVSQFAPVTLSMSM